MTGKISTSEDKEHNDKEHEDKEHNDDQEVLSCINNTKMTTSEPNKAENDLHYSTCTNSDQPPINKSGQIKETFYPLNEAFIKAISQNNKSTKDTVLCEQCGRPYESQMLLTNHILQEHDSEPF